MKITDALKALPQYILPQHGLSQLMSYLTHSEHQGLKDFLITQIIKRYGVNMAEAQQENPAAFKSFNAFFTRELKSGIRPITPDNKAVACPADGMVSQVGKITGVKVFQAKGKSFSVLDLLGGNVERAAPFIDGDFATIYLSPKDYHRLHMPLAGKLKEMVHIPGRLFSVNAATTRFVSGLFARNERVVAIFDTEAGPMGLVLVGAIFVSSIETVWHGVVTPPTTTSVHSWQYGHKNITYQKGEEMGRFNMGSTIILLFPKGKITWDADFVSDALVKLGQVIGRQ